MRRPRSAPVAAEAGEARERYRGPTGLARAGQRRVAERPLRSPQAPRPGQAIRGFEVTGEPFAQRVQALRDAWQERREVKTIASNHDYGSQYALLLTLHRWTAQAAEQIQETYEGSLTVTLSPAPDKEGVAGFLFVLADAFTVSFSLEERRRMGASRWHIAVSVAAGGAGGVVAAGPERRNGQWTRSRVEDLLLSVLGAYERSLADRRPMAPPEPEPKREAS